MLTPGRVRTRDGGFLSTFEHREGDGPLIVLCHATGFCKEVWLPVVADLAAITSGWTAVAIDQRHHGRSEGFPADFDWWRLGEDVLAVIGARRNVVAVGHSGGGAAVAMAELLEPGTISSTVLIEPIVFPPPFRVASDHPLADAARKRRRVFPSRADAVASYRGRGPFAQWDNRVLQSYVDGAFRDGPGGVELRGDAEATAQFFLHAYAHDAWDRLPDLEPPTALIAGENSDTHDAGFVNQLVSRIPTVTTEIVPGASHLLPMERPRLIAERIAAALESVTGAKPSDEETSPQ